MADKSPESGVHLPQHEPLAIVGIGCRLPGSVTDPESFWNLLENGRSGVVEVPANRWNKDRYYHTSAEAPGKMITKWGGFLDNLEGFDAKFFGITPREALRMDPQQRWLLEVTWEALEDAGVAPGTLRGAPVGVYVGIASNDYANVQMRNWADVDVHTNSGSTLSIASNRIAYLFDFKGPAVSVDTACSSALVAVNLACHSIWSRQCESALAGGVNALITPDASIGFSKASMLSPTGRCFAFDARANGYVRGEGAGMVYIKPLSTALSAGDPIYAVIRAAVVNQDGNTSSMTVPGVAGQSAMLQQAFAEAGVEPRHVVYMEAHGTGTPVGDPIELTALGNVLCQDRAEGEDCLIGSVKTNIGHLESAAGAAGLIKAALVLHKDTVPASLNFETPNPNIPFGKLRLKVADRLQTLPRFDGVAPVTAVNSFGFGGTNAHIVLQAAPATEKRAAAPAGIERPRLLPVSARDEQALRSYAAAYREFLAQSPAALEDICFSAGVHKENHELRLVAMGSDGAEIEARLQTWLHDPDNAVGVVTGRPAIDAREPVFVFTGQGAQWWAMGQQLLDREPVFRGAVDEIDRLFEPLAGWSLIEEMQRPEEHSRVALTDVAQPAIFALQVGLAALWKSWGIEPAKVIGHSVGEVAAAYCAGIYTLQDAVTVIYHRSRLQATTGGHGRMAAVGMSAADARRALRGRESELQLAGINSPNLVTLAGDTQALDEIVATLSDAGTFVRTLRIDYAFHSHQMDPIKAELLDALAGIEPRTGRIPFISAVTGGVLPGPKLDHHYWWKNVREAVLFGPAISNLVRGGENLFVELGPHPALQSAVNECLSEQGKKGGVFHSLRRNSDESDELLTNLAGLHVHGVAVDWAEINQSAGNFVRQPAYPWHREAFWLESEESAAHRLAPTVHPLLGLRVSAPQPTWQFELDPRLLGYLEDHRFWDNIVCPAAAYGEMGLAIARELYPDESHVVEDLVMKQALFVPDGQAPRVRVSFDESDKRFTVHSVSGGGNGWELNAEGRLQTLPDSRPPPANVQAIRERMGEYDDHDAYYEEYLKAGYQFGPNFRHLRQVWHGPGESIAEIVVPDEVAATLDAYHFHPAVLDACCHAVRGAMDFPDGARSEDYFYLPASIHRIRRYGAHPPRRFWAHCKIESDDGESVVANIFAYDDQGNRIADLLAFRADRVEQKSGGESLDNCFYQFRWEPCRLAGTGLDGSCEFTGPDEIVAATEAAAPAVYEAHDVHAYLHAFHPELDSAALALVHNAFISLGWDYAPGQDFHFDEFATKLGISPQHHRLARAQLNALAEDGDLRPEDENRYRVIKTLRETDADAHLQALGERYPTFSSETDLQRMTGARLAEVLTGRADPVEVLFPGGSSHYLEKFYVEGADFPAYAQLIAAAVKKAVERLPERRVLRVLEIGAGTGSLTRAVLGALPTERTEYVFSDIGHAFLAEARKQFADFPCVDFKSFDIEKDPAKQGLDPHGYDLVLATNVLHATSNLRVTLDNIKACLHPGAMLMFLEVTLRRLSNDNVFGLLKGWWQYEDVELRPHSALLDRAQWEALLTDSGFAQVTSFVDTPAPEDAGQTVFVATAPAADAAPGEEPDGAIQSPRTGAADPAGTCLILSDRSGIGDSLATAARQAGNRVVTARAGAAFACDDPDTCTVNPACTDDLRRLLDHVGESPAAIVHCFALDQPQAPELSLESLDEAQQGGVLSALCLTQALTALGLEPSPRVFYLTRGAQTVVDGDANLGLAATPIAGLARGANNEHFEFRSTLVDLDPDAGEFEIEDLTSEVLRGDEEFEVAHRAGRRYAHRLHRVKSDDLPKIRRNAVQPGADVLPYRLQIDKPGVLTNLSLNETRRRAPAPDEIEVEVSAGGINFRDVMKTLGMYPGNPKDLKWLGDDFAGTVIRVGENVPDLEPGDRVAGMAPYCFRSYVTVDRRMVFAIPATMSYEEAATLPTVFLTSHYAINHLARMQAREKILIHAGTGGVGQAAIQIARDLGLEIFATAGTPEKRRMLADMGVAHVMNSRTLEFADEVLEITSGNGVDAVLNSLSGDFIPKSFSVLAPFGRFLEIGKVDIYNNSRIGLEQLRNNISYFVIDLAQHLEHKPEFVADMLTTLSHKFRDGAYRPLPHTTFAITEAVEAFRYMAQGKHVGKNVLSFEASDIVIGPATEPGAMFREDAAYLITGGAGGFGLEVAKWMARNGARHLALMSRSGPREDAGPDLDALRFQGVDVIDVRGDITCAEALDDALARIRAELPPLRGIVHGAMVLDDENIVDLDESRFNQVLRPKMLGAWNLHLKTLDLPLEHFICFSSVSAVFGAIRQSNYNAGNVFLDALARYRHARGLPALTLNWGALSGAGFVERNEKTMQYLDKLGMKTLDMTDAMSVMERMLPLDPVQIAAARVDWPSLAKLSPAVARSNTFAQVVRSEQGGGSGGSVRTAILAAAPGERAQLLENFLATQVAGVFGMDVAGVERDVQLTNLGLDSLMAIELINRIEGELSMPIPMGSILSGPSIKELAASMLALLLDSAGSDESGAGAGVTSTAVLPLEKSETEVSELPLSEGQRALWFLNQLAPRSPAYNLTFSCKFRPLLDLVALEQAFRALFARHPMLDVTIHAVDGVPVQRRHRGRSIDFREHDATHLSDEQLKELLITHANQPFDLQHGPVVRLEMFRTADDAHLALLCMHHIVSDAWSVTNMVNDLIEGYFSIKAGHGPRYHALPHDYADYVEWETRHLASEAGQRMAAYWRTQLEDAPMVLDLPTDHPRPPVQSFSGATHSLKVDEELTQKVVSLAAEQNATLFTVLLSAYHLLLHRYCNQDDLVVGCPLAGRLQPELHALVGYFINPVALRSDVSDDPVLLDYLQRNSECVTGAIENQHYPMAQLVDALAVRRDPSRSPVFQVSFSMERIPGLDDQGVAVFLIGQGGHQFHVGDLSVETIDLTLRQAQFEITLVVEEAAGEIYGCWQYNRDLFDAATIEHLNELYINVLREIVRDPTQRVSALSLMPPDEMRDVLETWNDTAVEYPRDALLHDLIIETATRTPDTVAIVSGDQTLTFGELAGRAASVAARLQAHGAGTDKPIALLVDRTHEMVVSALAILQSGSCYVPIDPDFPPARAAQLLADAQPVVVLTQRSLRDTVPQGAWDVLCVDEIDDDGARPTAPQHDATALAYVVYTSGSTGNPKGVEVSHRNAVNLLAAMAEEPGLGASDRLLAVTTVSFDISVLELFGPLLAGACVVIASREQVKDARRLEQLIDDSDISVMQATPTTWQLLLDSGWTGKHDLRVLCGGEPLTRALADDLLSCTAEVWNLYGPTETTVWSTCERVVASDDAIAIGKPIANTRTYVLDRHMQPVPAGFVGELCIAGDGVARGYRGLPALTDERFVEVSLGDGRAQRLYRTGDLARWTRSGKLECLGRDDFQVKLRGVRMELGEIENHLVGHEDVKQAVVVKRDDVPGGAALAAYVVAEGDHDDLIPALREYLSDRLPDSMRPAYFTLLDELPLTPNRKLDRQRLPTPRITRDSLGNEYLPAQTPSEQALQRIFSAALGSQDIGLRDNFFEMGGDSLQAVQILVEVSSVFNREVPVDAFLKHPTIEQLARYLRQPASAAQAPPSSPPSSDAVARQPGGHLTIAGSDGADHPPQVDAVALAYIPDTLAELGLSRSRFIDDWFGRQPRVTNVYDLPMGRIGIVMLPCFETDLYRDQAGLRAPIIEALELAARMGAQTVSLTGVIPSVTDHGREILSWIGDRNDLPAVTTGDAMRTATVVKSVEGILAAADRTMSSEQLVVIGLGSIGSGALMLMLETIAHPESITLYDPFTERAVLERLRDEVVDAGFSGSVRILCDVRALPPEVYEASLFVGSTTLPGILDVMRLPRGALVVDYSFPPMFSVADATRRLETSQDILFTTGGQLRLGTAIAETLYLPEGLEELSDDLHDSFGALVSRDANEITGCVLVSLLTGTNAQARATLGRVQYDDVLAHYQVLKTLDVVPAQLQMDGYFVKPESIEGFRRTTRAATSAEPAESNTRLEPAAFAK